MCIHPRSVTHTQTQTVGDLIQYINSKMYRPEHAPLFIYVDNEIIVSRESTMAELYQEYREDDYFLYLAYYEENKYSQPDRSSRSHDLN